MKCKHCNKEKVLDDFYSSNKSTCKECVKLKSRLNRIQNIDHCKKYDRDRANLEHRVLARAIYRKTDNYKQSHRKANYKYRANNPSVYQAHIIVNNAIKSGKLKQENCLICGKQAEAHHFDYSLPLNVIWLCDEHHKHTHLIDNEIKRQLAKQPQAAN
ncbi:hypothetical protein HS327_00742 [Glaesserella parasuis]|uniref:hypothetical protein n=1 Tax=Glaesserella parasuis TaxID=738 RepID=UPI0004DD1003|nr:hypothetical protein [Glaesserella parasuis]KEZ23139.1 hypothetical protein HS327_00742 [Glaesserella parasuis]